MCYRYHHGHTCTIMATHVPSWPHMYHHGHTCLCTTMATHVPSWPHAHVPSWPHMYHHGHTRTIMATHVPSWPHMYHHDHTCTIMATHVPSWPHMYHHVQLTHKTKQEHINPIPTKYIFPLHSIFLICYTNLNDRGYRISFSAFSMLLSVSQCSWLSPFSSLHVQLQHHNGQLQVVIKETILHVACWYCTTQLHFTSTQHHPYKHTYLYIHTFMYMYKYI